MKNLKDVNFDINTNGIIQLFGNNSSTPNIKLQLLHQYPNIMKEFKVCYYHREENKNYEFILKDINEAKNKFIELYNNFENPIHSTYNTKYLYTYES